MPRDFRNFVNEKAKDVKTDNVKSNEYEKIINKYKDMDSSELMSNLFQEASKLKSEGKLDSQSLNNLKSTLSPFLNSEQQNMLNSLISAINSQK